MHRPFCSFLWKLLQASVGQSVDGDEEAAAMAVNTVTITTNGSSLVKPAVDDQDDQQERIALRNTFLKLHLTRPTLQSTDSHNKSSPKCRVGQVLESETIPCSPMHALILCSNHGYTPGPILPWKMTGICEDITILDGSGG